MTREQTCNVRSDGLTCKPFGLFDAHSSTAPHSRRMHYTPSADADAQIDVVLITRHCGPVAARSSCIQIGTLNTLRPNVGPVLYATDFRTFAARDEIDDDDALDTRRKTHIRYKGGHR